MMQSTAKRRFKVASFKGRWRPGERPGTRSIALQQLCNLPLPWYYGLNLPYCRWEEGEGLT